MQFKIIHLVTNKNFLYYLSVFILRVSVSAVKPFVPQDKSSILQNE